MLRNAFARLIRVAVLPSRRRRHRQYASSMAIVEGLEARRVLSATSVATVLTPPRVTHEPAAQTVAAEHSVSFSATASGTPTPSIQWQVSTDGGHTFHDVTGTNSTSTKLSFVATPSENGNEYRAVFKSAAGETLTSAALLTVQTAPTISANPQSQIRTLAQTFFLTATAGGNPAPTVQWQISTDNGKTWKSFDAIQTTTRSSQVWSSAQRISSHELAVGKYEFRATFTNSIGTATTAVATITIKAS